MNIAIVGLGIVGKGVYDIITQDFSDLKVSVVCEIDPLKLSGIKVPNIDYKEMLERDDIDLVVETVGGKDVAYDVVKQALLHKKHVVTANKAVISAFYKELTSLAKDMGVTLLFEASVGGAMHILEPLYQFSKHNKIHTIKGIINGSTNFILSKIFLEDYSYMQALGEADELGYIETGTTDDMDGLDLMRKINIASMISFDTEIKEEDITLVPLSSLTSEFYDYVKTQKKLIKYVATSKKQGQHISIHLEPVIIETGMLQHIHYEDNIIMLYGEYHRKQSFVGQGAGRYPTASAIINDILLIKNKNKRTFDTSKAYEINQFEELFDFIVQTKDDFKFMEKRSIQSLLDDPNIICFARMGGDLS